MKSGDYASLPAAEEETAAGAAPFPPIAAGKASTLQHLNGLRALAFLGVLLFHFRLGCSGGFLGVDVFFVLSGFLMTRSLQSQIERESFTFRSFFIRRLWRLYPALLATIITVLVLTYLIFSLGHTEAVARSALASVGGVSNVLFMLQDDYFGSSAAYKPLLHTWSLSVEWQFYAVWPLLLIGCATFRSSAGDTTALRAMLAVLSSASLGYACLVPNGQYAFFSLPSRIFEFCCGAVLASSPPGAPGALAASPFLSNAVGAVGTAIICASFSVVTSSQPGLVSLLPVLGSMMVIATPSDAIANQLFTLPPVEYIGRVSYSAYLVHWPLYVFYTTLFGDGTHPLEDKLVLLSATGALSILLYHAVEDKFRFAKERWQSTVGCSMLAACVAISASALLTGGWRWRAIDAGGSARSAEFYQQQYMRLVALTPADQRVGATNNLVPKERDIQLSPVTAFVIGDSHAEHLLGALDPISRETNMTFFMRTHHGCGPYFSPDSEDDKMLDRRTHPSFPTCKRTLRPEMLAAATASKARVLVVASHWTQNYEAFWPESDKTVVVRDGETRLEVSLRILADANPAKEILFIGQVPGSHYDYRACLADASAPLARRWKSCPSSTRNSYPWVGDREQMNRMIYIAATTRRLDALFEQPAVRAMLDRGQMEYLRPAGAFCSDTGVCDMSELHDDESNNLRPESTRAERVMYWDDSHLTVVGALRLKQKIQEALLRLTRD